MKLYPNISLIFCIWTLSLLMISFFGYSLLPHSEKAAADFVSNLSIWDGGHYLNIAKYGYSEKIQYAFFPMYPLLIRVINLVFQNYLISGLLISVVSSFLAIQILYKLVILDFDKKIAEKVILSLLLFPTAFYFLIVYSEGLFFLLTVSSFYFLRRNKLLLAVIFASLASATRLSGLAVVLAILIDVQINYGINKKNWFVLLSPLGFILYCWFLFQQTNDPLYFLTAENNWQRYLTLPGISFWESIRNISSGNLNLNNFNIFLDLVFSIFGLGFVIRSFRFLPSVYSFYGTISLAFPLFTSTLISIPRFLVVLFPIFILIALIKNKYVSLTYQVISLMLLSLFVSLFINGYWVS